MLDLSVERDFEEFDIIANFGSVEDGLAIDCPNRDIAAPTVKIGYIKEFGYTFVATAIRELLESIAICLDNVGMAIVVLSRNEKNPFSIG